MGYYVKTRGIDFTIPKEHLEAACKALKDLNKRDDLKTGGSWGPLRDAEGNLIYDENGKIKSGQTERWFAWMSADYDKTLHSAEEILKEVGFEVYDNGESGIELSGYDSKSGQEEHFVAALAPFVREGSYIEWEGEDGELWRQVKVGDQIVTQSGYITYDENGE
ncbi:hypothetical protein SEA_RIZWANA_68 [Arthrobacter phage Rizwana]|nr:hypothetical protein SEA_RIZWANA_68 [Arthrobacter phage Rizwana]